MPAGAKKAASKAPAKRRPRKPRKQAGRLLAHGCAFTTEIREAILGFAEGGLPRKYAAAKVGIGERTLQRWVERGRDNLAEVDDSEGQIQVDEYGLFVMRLIQAEAYARGEILEQIRRAVPEDWKAGAWILERVDSAQFGQSHKVEAITRDEHGEEVSAGDMLIERLFDMKDKDEALSGDGEQ